MTLGHLNRHVQCSVTSNTVISLFFFFNDTATTEIYTLSLHDALPISARPRAGAAAGPRSSIHTAPRAAPCRHSTAAGSGGAPARVPAPGDRKSTRLNSSHSQISYAVFCLKKKKITYNPV